MKHPEQISIQEYTFRLPEEYIAKYPLPQRDASRLLIYKEGKITEDIYRNIAHHLPVGSLLLFNDTKVVEARLLFQKPTGGVIEIFCLEPHVMYGNIAEAMRQKCEVVWNCLIGGASKWKRGQVPEKIIDANGKKIFLRAHYIEKGTDSFTIRLTWNDEHLSFAEILHFAGAIPLPPYIKRNPATSDKETYQTIYAREEGSVAAPTAGLHFTDTIFNTLKERGIQTGFITLHVGAGTFKPVKSERLEEHEMHAEYFHVSAGMIRRILDCRRHTIVTVGTTTLRTLESIYWLGVKTKLNPQIQPSSLALSQWEAYDLEKENISVTEALEALLSWLEKNKLPSLFSKTQLLIAPGYEARMADALVTNFHLPQSTLLLLVAALTGENWKKIYSYALEKKFRFLSYGDGSLIWIKK